MTAQIVAAPSTGLVTALLPAEIPGSALAQAARLAAAVPLSSPTAAAPSLAPLLAALLHEAEGLPPQATLLAGGGRTAAPLAAGINAVAASAPAETEPVLPALFASLAAAELEGAGAADWLAAFAAGAEVSLRLVRGLAAPGVRPYDPAIAAGLLGATLAVCRVLRLAPAAAAPALGLAAIQLAGTAAPGTAERALALANACRVAVESAYLGRFGATGPLNCVRALGLMLNAPQLEGELDGLGSEWIIAAGAEPPGDPAALLPPAIRTLLA